MENIISLEDFLKDPASCIKRASDVGTVIIEGDKGCFTLSRAKISNIIIPDQNTDDVLRQYYRSQNVEAKAVDLGLSVKWAAGNLWAIKETDFGGFFYTGDIIPQTFGKGLLGKPNLNRVIDGTLPLDYDAAHHRLGYPWRMPTKEECYELIHHCKWTFIENYLGSGKNGWKVSSLIPGYEENYIFFPASSGYFNGDMDEWLKDETGAVIATSTIKSEGHWKNLGEYLAIDEHWQQIEERNGVADICNWSVVDAGVVIRAVRI